MHLTTHGLKYGTAQIPYQDIRLTRKALADFLQTGLNGLEKALSKEYGTNISASVKLCTKPTKLKTFVRGKNNVISRSGISNTKTQDAKEYGIASNYAYKTILER